MNSILYRVKAFIMFLMTLLLCDDILKHEKVCKLYNDVGCDEHNFIKAYTHMMVTETKPNRKLRRDERQCPICDTIFRIKDTGQNSRVYCSNECASIGQELKVRYREEALYHLCNIYSEFIWFRNISLGSYGLKTYCKPDIYNVVPDNGAVPKKDRQMFFPSSDYKVKYRYTNIPDYMVVNHKVLPFKEVYRQFESTWTIGNIYNAMHIIEYPQLIGSEYSLDASNDLYGEVSVYKSWKQVLDVMAQYVSHPKRHSTGEQKLDEVILDVVDSHTDFKFGDDELYHLWNYLRTDADAFWVNDYGHVPVERVGCSWNDYDAEDDDFIIDYGFSPIFCMDEYYERLELIDLLTPFVDIVSETVGYEISLLEFLTPLMYDFGYIPAPHSREELNGDITPESSVEVYVGESDYISNMIRDVEEVSLL